MQPTLLSAEQSRTGNKQLLHSDTKQAYSRSIDAQYAECSLNPNITTLLQHAVLRDLQRMVIEQYFTFPRPL